MRCTVQCLADYKVSPQDLTGIIVNTANIIFDQNWEKEQCVLDDKDQIDTQSDITESDDDEPQADENASTSKRRMSQRDLTYVFPSSRTINRYLEDA